MNFKEFDYCMRRKCKECERALVCDRKEKHAARPLTYRPFECLRDLWLELIKREKDVKTSKS
jgi:hypothetical protein